MAALIYIVDDERVIATTLAAIMRVNGFQSQPFFSPIEALTAAKTQAPDLLISDVMMPEMDGVELAIRVKMNCPDCKVLLFSGQAATASLLDKARQDGHNFEVLSKPLHPTELLAAIRKSDLTATPA